MKWIIFLFMLLSLLLNGCHSSESKYDIIIEEELESPISIQYVFDVKTENQELKYGDGFALLITSDTNTVLMDTPYIEKFDHRKGEMLNNMNVLGIDPMTIDTVFISHEHSNRGLPGILDLNSEVRIYSPKDDVIEMITDKRNMDYIEVAEFTRIDGSFYSTGTMEGIRGGEPVPEQGLILEMDTGLILICGCSHPDIINMVDRANESFNNKSVTVLIGGLHMKDTSDSQDIESVMKALEERGVEHILPGHCSGKEFCDYIKEHSTMNYYEVGAGTGVLIR